MTKSYRPPCFIPSSPSPTPRSSQPPIIHTPAGSLPKLWPPLGAPSPPSEPGQLPLTFQATLVCHFLQEAFLGLPITSNPPFQPLLKWLICGCPISVRFFDDCLPCQQALSFLRGRRLAWSSHCRIPAPSSGPGPQLKPSHYCILINAEPTEPVTVWLEVLFTKPWWHIERSH